MRVLLNLLAAALLSYTSNDEAMVNELFEIMEKGDREIDLHGRTKFAVLLGLTGSGKSTLAHYLSGNPETLSGKFESGKLVFIDTEGKISTDDMISKTLFPFMTIENDLEGLVDTPGFEDSRNASYEISASYFIKKVLETPEYVKFVMTAPQSAFDGGDRKAFDQLMTNMIQLVIDIDKYKDAFCLVVTKVLIQNFNDSVEVGFIKEMLVKKRNEYNTMMEDETEAHIKEEIARKIKIVEALLDEKVNRIAVGRRPEKEGPILESEYSMQNRKNLRKLVFDTIDNVEPGVGFSYPLSLRSENFIRERIYPEISKRITELIKRINNAMLDWIYLTGERSNSITSLKTDIKTLNDFLWSVDVDNISREIFEEYIKNCIKYLNAKVQFAVTPDMFTNLLAQFDFMRSFTDKIDEPLEDWMKALSPSRDCASYVWKWYLTLISVFEVAEKGDTQKTKITKFDPSFFDLTYTVIESGAHEFLEKVKRSGLTEYPNQLNELLLSNLDFLRPFILHDVNSILNLIRPNISCSDGLLTVRSNFVSFTCDVLHHINKGKCENISVINIIGYEKIFLDSDLELPDTDISIIGMDWVITKGVNLDVSGLQGPDRVPPKALMTSTNGDLYHGLKGLPGQPGGIIFGIAYKFENVNSLKILSNGGRGGTGQHGGDGNFVSVDNEYPWGERVFKDIRTYEEGYCKEIYHTCDQWDSNPHFDRYDAHDHYKELQQRPSKSGAGGNGGYPGKINVVKMMTDTTIYNETQLGNSGASGDKSIGWALSVSYIQCNWGYTSSCLCNRYYCDKKRVDSSKRQISGEYGTSNSGEILPSNRTNPFESIEDIIEYRFYILEIEFINDKEEFLRDLITNHDILKYYDIHAFIKEIMILEERKSKVRPDLLVVYGDTMIPILQSWSKYSEDDLQVLTFLVCTLSSIIWNQQTSNETTFVVNLHEYVETSLEAIAQAEALGMIQTVENLKDSYSKSMDQNILEAQNYINTFVTKEFDEIFVDMRKSIDNLVTEVKDLESDVQDHLDELREKEKQLRKNMIAHCVFGVLNVAAAALSMMGPVGSAAGLALGAASGIAGSIIIADVNIDPNDKLSLPKGIYNLLNYMQALSQSRQEGHVEVLIFSCESYLQMPEISTEEENQLNEIKEKALTVKDISNIQEIDKIVQDCIKDLQAISKNLKPGESEKLQKLLNNTNGILEYAASASKIAGPILDGMKNYKEDGDKLEIVMQMIKEDEQKLKDLGDYQEGIYEVIVPMLDMFYEDMSTLEEELTNQSSVSLVVKRWQVSNQIQKIADAILYFTEGFKVEKDMLKHFQKINEASNLVVTLFEQIQYYQEHKEFANYIGNLHQVGGGNIPPNSEYKVELAALKKSIITNTVRSQCNTIISSFTQQVFPFAKNHLGSIPATKGEFCEGNDVMVTNTIITVRDQMRKIRDTIIGNKDEFVHIGMFDSNFVSAPPFAYWYNYTHGDEINKLLSGEEVILIAPITGKKNAVKFNKISIRFNRTDGGSQQEFEEILKKFTMEQTHFGNSLYKCDDFQFLIRSAPIKIVYSLETKSDGEPVSHNMVYEKIQKGDITLSPYTTWRLKLRATYRAEADFALLKQFTKNNVNLEMYGKGQFVEKDVAICKANLDEYYEFYQPWVRI